MEKRYRVTLTREERQGLQALVSVGKGAARKLVRARILLLADQAEEGPARPDPEIVDALGCGRATVERVRKLFVEGGLDATLRPKPTTRTYERKFDGRAEAHLIALACGALPRAGRGGRCACSATAWWAWDIWNRCLTRRCGGR